MTTLGPAKKAIIEAANRLTILPRTLGRKNLDEAVCILRRRGDRNDVKLLIAAGYNVLEYERRPKSQRRVRF